MMDSSSGQIVIDTGHLFFDTGIWLWLLGTVVALAGWEWRKMRTMQGEFDALKKDMNSLHAEHRKLLSAASTDNTQVLRDLTRAIEKMHDSMDDLAHYIRWLGEATTNTKPPPPINRGDRR